MQLLISFIVGSVSGLIYGLSFGAHQRRVFALPPGKSSPILWHVTFVLCRILLLFFCCYYLLHSPKIHFILVSVSFISAFWCAIFKIKGIRI